MSEPKLPHFLRVVRAVARVRGAALPIAAVATTVVAGLSCGAHSGVFVGHGGSGGATTTSTNTGGMGTGGGSPICLGVCIMPDGG